MGAKSTIDLTKNEALQFVADHLYNVDNETLTRIVEEVNDEMYEKNENNLGLSNFTIVES